MTLTAGEFIMKSSFQTFARCKLALVWLVGTVPLTTAGVSAEEQPLRAALPYDNFEIREEMVPMRDGVQLYTLILSPKHSGDKLPVILTRRWC